MHAQFSSGTCPALLLDDLQIQSKNTRGLADHFEPIRWLQVDAYIYPMASEGPWKHQNQVDNTLMNCKW